MEVRLAELGIKVPLPANERLVSLLLTKLNLLRDVQALSSCVVAPSSPLKFNGYDISEFKNVVDFIDGSYTNKCINLNLYLEIQSLRYSPGEIVALEGELKNLYDYDFGIALALLEGSEGEKNRIKHRENELFANVMITLLFNAKYLAESYILNSQYDMKNDTIFSLIMMAHLKAIDNIRYNSKVITLRGEYLELLFFNSLKSELQGVSMEALAFPREKKYYSPLPVIYDNLLVLFKDAIIYISNNLAGFIADIDYNQRYFDFSVPTSPVPLTINSTLVDINYTLGDSVIYYNGVRMETNNSILNVPIFVGEGVVTIAAPVFTSFGEYAHLPIVLPARLGMVTIKDLFGVIVSLYNNDYTIRQVSTGRIPFSRFAGLEQKTPYLYEMKWV